MNLLDFQGQMISVCNSVPVMLLYINWDGQQISTYVVTQIMDSPFLQEVVWRVNLRGVERKFRNSSWELQNNEQKYKKVTKVTNNGSKNSNRPFARKWREGGHMQVITGNLNPLVIGKGNR